MTRKRILLGLNEDEKAYGVFRLIDDFERAGFTVTVLKTKTSENLLPFYYWEKYLKKEGSFDFALVYPLTTVFEHEMNNENTEDELAVYLKNSQLPYYGVSVDQRYDTKALIANVKHHFKSDELSNYSFLVTLGGLTAPLDSQHYLAGYQNTALMENFIEQIALKGGILSVVATEDLRPVLFSDDVVYVKNKEEYESVLNAKAFRYDIILDGCKIPRFQLSEGEEVHVEYQKYYAELEEAYLPFQDKGLLSNNQVIMKFFDGYEMDRDSIDYYFENTGIHGIICNEKNEADPDTYKGFSKLYTRTHSLRVVSYQKLNELSEAIINECITMLEGS